MGGGNMAWAARRGWHGGVFRARRVRTALIRVIFDSSRAWFSPSVTWFSWATHFGVAFLGWSVVARGGTLTHFKLWVFALEFDKFFSAPFAKIKFASGDSDRTGIFGSRAVA